jgi:multicomponent Na+:H+ antiporter subunit G
MSDFLSFVGAGLGGGFVALGALLMVGAGIGMLRFPDFYTRIHAVNVDGLGVALALFGLALAANDGALALELGLLAVLVLVLGPVQAALIANSAHSGGLAPLAGRYISPRPGARGKGGP